MREQAAIVNKGMIGWNLANWEVRWIQGGDRLAYNNGLEGHILGLMQMDPTGSLS